MLRVRLQLARIKSDSIVSRKLGQSSGQGVGAYRRESSFNGASSEANCFGALRVMLRCIISGNSRLFRRHFRLFFVFSPAGARCFWSAKGVRLRLAKD